MFKFLTNSIVKKILFLHYDNTRILYETLY
jgi:hypothetical protein